MKRILFLWLCSIFISQLFAQSFEKKQITNFDFDSRGASFPVYPSMGFSNDSESLIFFEAHNGDSSNLMMLYYRADLDSFLNPVKITEGNFLNINPVAIEYPFYLDKTMNLIWQTNENGNWDIVKKTYSDSSWNEKTFLLDSPDDEINPTLILDGSQYIFEPNEFEFLFEKKNSIYLYHQKDTIIGIETIFEGNDTLNFTHPTGAYVYESAGGPSPGLYVAATCYKGKDSSKIVYRIKALGDSVWRPTKILFNDGFAENPKFFHIYDDPSLSFETTISSTKAIYIFMDVEQFGKNSEAIPLLDNTSVETSDLVILHYLIITDRLNKGLLSNQKNDFFTWLPHGYKFISGDSVKVVCSPYYGIDDLAFRTQIEDTRIAVGNLGQYPFGYAISYTVWEDSSDGHINLFGIKRSDAFGDVNDKIIANSFILYQNFPNPFNPKTLIKYELLKRDFVNLKVYDILGNEVAAIVNEEKDAGVYNATFDGLNFASGIYIYRLSVGDFHLSKKMILLK